MKLLIVGTGYVGLVTGSCFAEMGHQVICLDIDQKRINDLKKGIVDLYEPGLDSLIHRNLQTGRLRFTTDYEEGKECAICFIAVPTPSKEGEGSCDLSCLLEATRSLAETMCQPQIIVIKSTVPVGTTRQMREWISSHQKTKIPFEMVSNPEFLREGSALSDCMKPDRVILGVDSHQAAQSMKKLYTTFTFNHERILIMDIASAEMTKYVANAMLALRISFMNEISWLCDLLGASISQVRVGIGADQRIGYDYLYAGVGFGGSCFPKDLRALQREAQRLGCETPLLLATQIVNQRQLSNFLEKIYTYFSPLGGLQNKKIAIWGLSFKPNTDDLREAPSLKLIQALLERGASLALYDPVAMPKAKKSLNHLHIRWSENEYDAAEGSDGILLVTEWKQFRFVDLDLLLKRMTGRAFFDGRNQYDRKEMIQKGFDYFGIGV